MESEVGYLVSDLMRAARLVVDTGLHYKEWTMEQAMAYMEENVGEKAEDEVERYLVMPGQACAYKLGELKIVELRERAQAELGSAFDIREFHNIILTNGSMPLTVLENQVDRYIEANRDN